MPPRLGLHLEQQLEVHLLVGEGEGEVELQILEEEVEGEGVGEVDHQVQEEGEEVGQWDQMKVGGEEVFLLYLEVLLQALVSLVC